jgi:hypothetical protein
LFILYKIDKQGKKSVNTLKWIASNVVNRLLTNCLLSNQKSNQNQEKNMNQVIKPLVLTIAFLLGSLPAQPALAVLGRINLQSYIKKDEPVPVVTIFNKDDEKIGVASYNKEQRIWYFDFPERNTPYVAKWPGGGANLTSPFLSDFESYLAGGAALVTTIGIGLAVVDMSSSSDTSSSIASGSTIPTCESLNGIYIASGPRTINTCDTSISDLSGALRIGCSSGSITMQSRVMMYGSYTDASGALSASGSGDTGLSETFSCAARTADKSISVRGELQLLFPNGCRIGYDATMVKQ